MSGSIYNDDEPFNASLFLYLQPRIQVSENIKSVEEAVEFYNLKKDDSNYTEQFNRLLWSLSHIPDKFEPLTYIVLNKLTLDVSQLNISIKESMIMDGFTDEDILDTSTHVQSIGKVAKISATNTFQFDPDDPEIIINPKILNVGDELRIVRKIVFTTLFVRVTQILDDKTFVVTHDNETFDLIDDEYDILGILVADFERIGRINYLQYLINNDEPPNEFTLDDSLFNPGLYKTFYPETINLNDEDTYLHYQDQKINNEYVIGSKQDLIRIILRNKNESQSNDLFDRLTVTNRCIFDFPQDKQSGFLRFIDKDIYYVTNDSTRSSVNLNSVFEGLITEKAIKKYVEDKISDPTFTNLSVASNAEFLGNVSILGTSNIILDASLQNINLENATFRGSNPVQFESPGVFNDKVTFKDDIIFVDPVEFNVDIIGQCNVTIKNELLVDGASQFKGSNTFDGTTKFDNITHFNSNVFIHHPLEVNAESRFGEIVVFNAPSYFEDRLEVNKKLQVNETASLDVHGDVVFSSNTIDFNDSAIVQFNTAPLFQTPITFSNEVKTTGDVILSGCNILTNETVVYDNLSVFGDTDFHSSNTNFVHISVNDLISKCNSIFQGNSVVFNTTSNIFNTPTEFNSNVTCFNDITLHSNVDVLDVVNFLGNTEYHNSNVTFHEGFLSRGRSVYDESSYTLFKGVSTFSNDAEFTGKVNLFEDSILTIQSSNTTFSGHVEFQDITEFHGPIRCENKVELFSNVILRGDTSFESSVQFFQPVTLNSNINVKNLMKIEDGATFETSPDALTLFNNPVTFSNSVFFHDRIDFLDVNIHGSSLFENTVIFDSNVRINDKLTVNDININNNAQFLAKTVFKNDVIFESNVEFPSETTHVGKSIFNSNITLNNSATFNGITEFNNNSVFIGETTFSGKGIFDNTAIFHESVEFNDHTIFNHTTTFLNDTSFDSLVRFTDDVVFENRLYLDDAFITALHASNVHINELDVNKIKIKAICDFDSNSVLSGYVTFKDGVVNFEEDTFFHNPTLFSDKVSLSNKTFIYDSLDIKTDHSVFSRGVTTFSNNYVDVQAPFYFNCTPTFCNLAIFEENSQFNKDIEANKNIHVNDTLNIRSLLQSQPQSKVYLRGDIQMQDDVAFKSDALFHEKVVSSKLFETASNSLSVFRGETLFQGDVTFDPSKSTFCNELHVPATATFYSRVNVLGEIFLHADTFIERGHIKDLQVDTSRFTSNVIFTKDSATHFQGGLLLIDTSNLSVPQKSEFGHIMTSNINVKSGNFLGEQYFHDKVENNGPFIINNIFETTSNATVNFQSLSTFNNDVHFTDQSKVLVQDLNVDHGSFSNMETNYLRIHQNLDIDFIDIENIYAHNSSNERCYIELGISDKHQISNLTCTHAHIEDAVVESGKCLHLAVNELYSSNLEAKNIVSEEAELSYLKSGKIVTDEIRSQYMRTLISSNDDAFFLKQTTDKLKARELDVDEANFEKLLARRINSDYAKMTDLTTVHGSFDTIVSTYDAKFQNCYSMSNFARYFEASNAQIDNMTAEFLDINKTSINDADIEKVNVQTMESETHSNDKQFSKTLTSSNIFVHDLEGVHTQIEFANIVSLSNDHQVSENLIGKNILTNDLEINSNVINQGNTVLSGQCTMCNHVDFLNPVDFSDPVSFNGGDVTINGQNNKINNVDMMNTQLNGIVNFNSTPFFDKNVVVKGAYFGSRIGLGPYKRSLGLGDRIDMTHVAFLNAKTGTKIFAHKSNKTIGLNGGELFLEVLKYPNAIVQLDQGMQEAKMTLLPSMMTQEMIGTVGTLTYIERSIYGRNLVWKPNFTFSSTNDNQYMKTTPSPDTNGGYTVNVFQYTILGPDLITAKTIDVSVVEGSVELQPEIVWDYLIANTSLYITSISPVTSSSFVTVFQRLSSTISNNYLINFSPDLQLDSDLFMTFIILQNRTTGLPSVNLTLYEKLTNARNPIDITLRSTDLTNISWCFENRLDDNDNILELGIFDQNNESVNVPVPNTSFERDTFFCYTIAHHENNTFVPTWYRFIRNLIIKDIYLHPLHDTYVCCAKPDAYIADYTSFFEEYDTNTGELLHQVSMHTMKSNIIKVTSEGNLLWSITLNENASFVTGNTNDIIVAGNRKHNTVSTFKDTTSTDVQFLKLSQEYDMSNVFVVSFNTSGHCKWRTIIASLSKQILTTLTTLYNQDVIVTIHCNLPEMIYAYNSVDVIGMKKNPILSEMGKTLPEESWDDYEVIFKYNSIGYVQWMLMISCIEDNIKVKNNHNDFVVVVMPKSYARKGMAEFILFNRDESIAFDGTFLMDEQRSEIPLSNEVDIHKSCAVVASYNNSGKLKWVITLRSLKLTTKFDNMDICVLEEKENGIIIGFGNNLQIDDVYDVPRDIEICDARGNKKVVSNLCQMKFTSWGSFIGDP